MRLDKPRDPRQFGLLFTDEMARAVLAGVKTETRRPLARAPKVKPGDELYPRVTFVPVTDGSTFYRYEISDAIDPEEHAKEQGFRWTPSIHMPKDRTPFFMLVVEVVEENLHDITEEGAKAEGACEMFVTDLTTLVQGRTLPKSTHLNGFRSLWDALYGQTPNAWEKNPRVVVYRWKELRRLTC